MALLNVFQAPRITNASIIDDIANLAKHLQNTAPAELVPGLLVAGILHWYAEGFDKHEVDILVSPALVLAGLPSAMRKQVTDAVIGNPYAGF